jgi:hypothetical protein
VNELFQRLSMSSGSRFRFSEERVREFDRCFHKESVTHIYVASRDAKISDRSIISEASAPDFAEALDLSSVGR